MTEHDGALRHARDVAALRAAGLPVRDAVESLATALLAYHAECERLRKAFVRRATATEHCRHCRDCGDGPCCDRCDVQAAIDALIGKAVE